MSETTEVTCPSGLRGRVRKWTVAELARFQSAKGGAARATALMSLLSTIWEETLDPGPYPFLVAGPQRVDFGQLIVQDVSAAVMLCRAHSVSRFYDQTFHCGECGAANILEADILSDQFEPRRIPDATARVVRHEAGVFVGSIRGKRVTYRLLTAAMETTIDETRARVNKDRQKAGAELLPPKGTPDRYAAQSDFIEELGLERSRDQGARLDYFLNLFPSEEYDFAEAVREHDFGMGAAEQACGTCNVANHVWPVFDPVFFRPPRLPARDRAARAADAARTPDIAAAAAEE